MKRSLVPVALLLLVVSAGCASQTAEPNPTPSPSPSPSPSPTPAGPASCYLASVNLTEMPLPPITEADQVQGPADADIVVVEYADFQ